mgnify:CR=1 FL=1
MISIKNDFDIDSTITCGQIFRYTKENINYTIILKDRVISLTVDNQNINIESNNEDNLEEVINDYFDLKRDYKKIEDDIIKMDKNIEQAILESHGLHMIHQDPFETIISYVISQNNRVPSITNSLNLIAQRYGKKIVFKDKEYYLFPSYQDLKTIKEEEYRECKVGFRDKYLLGIVESINNKTLDLDKIYDMTSDEALNYLMSFKGIGNKVASCILLFAYQKFDVYPIDTWVKKFMKDDYNIEGLKEIKEFTVKTYKEYSGLAIQYMFNYKRNKSNLQN